MKDKGTFLPTYKGCLVCGQKYVNPCALNLRFRITDEGVETPFMASTHQEGYKDIVHGGIISSVLDETIGWAVAVDRKRYFMTGELVIRFLRPLPIGHRVIVRGRSVEHKSRYSVGEGEMLDAEGIVYARAKGKFFLMSDEQAREVHSYLTIRENDLDFLKNDSQ